MSDMTVYLAERVCARSAGADLGFIKGGGLTQGTNLLGRGVRSILELGGSGGMPPPPRKILKNRC